MNWGSDFRWMSSRKYMMPESPVTCVVKIWLLWSLLLIIRHFVHSTVFKHNVTIATIPSIGKYRLFVQSLGVETGTQRHGTS